MTTFATRTEVRGHSQALPEALEHGQLFWFADWRVAACRGPAHSSIRSGTGPASSSTSGLAGRGETSAVRGFGPFGRLASHASGRRSGDQFCVYVCDRLVLPAVQDRIDDITAGTLSVNRATRNYVRAELGFRMAKASAAGTSSASTARSQPRAAASPSAAPKSSPTTCLLGASRSRPWQASSTSQASCSCRLIKACSR